MVVKKVMISISKEEYETFKKYADSNSLTFSEFLRLSAQLTILRGDLHAKEEEKKAI